MGSVRILALMPDAYGGFGGIAQYNRDLLDSLSESPAVESILSMTRHVAEHERDLPSGIQEHIVPGNPLRYCIAATYQTLKLRPGLILCGHFNLLPIAVMLKRMTGAPILLEAYGIEAWRRESFVRMAGVREVDLVISISRFTRAQLIKWSGVEAHRIKVIPNAIHLDAYKPSSKPDYLLKRYGLYDRKILLTIGRLIGSERYKGHDKVINMLTALKAIVPNVTYLIVGDGSDRPRLEQLVRETGNLESVVFAGRIPEGEKIDHYNLSDAFAMPSMGEGFGFVFLEAIACGLPVLGGSEDGSRDALLDGHLGIMVDPEDTLQLQSGLVRILQSEKKVPGEIWLFDFLRFKSQVHQVLEAFVAQSMGNGYRSRFHASPPVPDNPSVE